MRGGILMMNNGTSHWGPSEAGGDRDAELPLRMTIEAELAESRLFVDQVYRERENSGSRRAVDRIAEPLGDLPWFLVNARSADN